MPASHRPSRPGQLDSSIADQLPGGADPQKINEMSHISAASLLDKVHHTTDPQIVEKVITLVDHEGVDIIAELWSNAPAETLPGTLWRLYLLRSWMQQQGDVISQLWKVGEPTGTAASAITGVDPAPNADDITRLADSILSGAFTGDFAVALERASSFCEVIARGLSAITPTFNHAPQSAQHLHAAQMAGEAGRRYASAQKTVTSLISTSKTFSKAAELWRKNKLE